MGRLTIILTIVAVISFTLHITAQNLSIRYIDTLETGVSDTYNYPNCKYDSTRTLFIDSIYATFEYFYSEPDFDCNSMNCVVENFWMLSVKQFYNSFTNKKITISEAFQINFDFTYFILRFKSDYFFTPYCFTAFANSKLYVQNDIEYTASLKENFNINDGSSNSPLDSSEHDIKSESRLVVYKNGIREKVFCFFDEKIERESYPFGMAILQEKYLIAGYNSIPRKGYNHKFVQKIYIIDISNDEIVGTHQISNISCFYTFDGFLYLVYYDGEKELLIKCMIEKE